MNVRIFSVAIEVYLVAGTGLVLAALVNPRLKQAARRWELLFRPNSTKLEFKLVKIVLLVIFIPLTILYTLGLMGV